MKTVIDKVKCVLSPSTKRRTEEISIVDDIIPPPRECRHSSIISLSNRNHPKNLLRHKSVSFAENTVLYNNSIDRTSIDSTDDQKIIVDDIHTIGFQTLMPTIDEAATNQMNTSDNMCTFDVDDDDGDDENFTRDFYQSIKPRRVSIGNSRDLIYQDLSAEIVSYVLKHAIRMIEQEDEENFADLK